MKSKYFNRLKKFLSKHAATTGNDTHAATTGYSANAATTGDRANAATTGDWAHAATTGDRATACALGVGSQSKASIGSWIVVAEWKVIKGEWTIANILSEKVDGKKIKADVFYTAKKGKLVEVKH